MNKINKIRKLVKGKFEKDDWKYHMVPVLKYAKKLAKAYNADAMAHFDEIPQLFESAFIRFKINPKEGRQWVLDKLERDWKKLTPKIRKINRLIFSTTVSLINLGC